MRCLLLALVLGTVSLPAAALDDIAKHEWRKACSKYKTAEYKTKCCDRFRDQCKRNCWDEVAGQEDLTCGDECKRKWNLCVGKDEFAIPAPEAGRPLPRPPMHGELQPRDGGKQSVPEKPPQEVFPKKPVEPSAESRKAPLLPARRQ